MDIKKLFQNNDDLAASARKFVEASQAFLEKLSASGEGLELAIAKLDETGGPVDYDAPVLDAYKKTYNPITLSEIARVNKEMSEAIAGEKWVEGFITCVQLMMMFKP